MAVITSDSPEEASKKPKRAKTGYDIQDVLEAEGHRTHVYDNGITLGVKLSRLKGSRGIHVSVAHAIDFRKAKFGRAKLAQQSAILNHVDKDLKKVLSDIGLENQLMQEIRYEPSLPDHAISDKMYGMKRCRKDSKLGNLMKKNPSMKGSTSSLIALSIDQGCMEVKREIM